MVMLVIRMLDSGFGYGRVSRFAVGSVRIFYSEFRITFCTCQPVSMSVVATRRYEQHLKQLHEAGRERRL